MLLAYLPALIFEAFLETLNQPARRADIQSEYDHPEGELPHGG